MKSWPKTVSIVTYKGSRVINKSEHKEIHTNNVIFNNQYNFTCKKYTNAVVDPTSHTVAQLKSKRIFW